MTKAEEMARTRQIAEGITSEMARWVEERKEIDQDNMFELFEEKIFDQLLTYGDLRAKEMRDEAVRNRPEIVCLCGSGRFKEAFDKAEFDETLSGKIVLTIGCNTKDVARDFDLAKHKPLLDELHKRKIDLADEILVLNVGGYVGDSTRSEIAYAEKLGKPIRYLVANAISKLGEGVSKKTP